MSHDPEMLDILQQSIRSTGRKQLLVAALALPTGAFMASAEAMGLDPSSFQNMTAAGRVMLYGISLTCILFGLWTLYSSLILNPRRGRLFLKRLDVAPDQIRRVRHNLLQGGRAHQLQVEYQKGSKWYLAVNAGYAEAILDYVAQRAPHAVH